jgi:hypothetical protein
MSSPSSCLVVGCHLDVGTARFHASSLGWSSLSTAHGAAGLIHRLIGLEGGVDGEAVLAEEEEPSSEDVDHLISDKKWDVEGLRALISFC